MSGGTIVFIILGLVFWGISRFMKKSWDMPGDDAEYEPAPRPEDGQRPSRPVEHPVFTYEDENAETVYSEAPQPVLYSAPPAPPAYMSDAAAPVVPMATDSELQAKLASYSNVETAVSAVPLHPVQQKVSSVSYATGIRKGFDLRTAVIYAEILAPKYKEY